MSGGLLKSGTVLDCRYEIKRLIKSGGMGAIYEVLDNRFEQKSCALKEMLHNYPDPAEQKYFIDSFKKEAHILNKLKHPNLPSVTDYFVEKGRYYLVMDYIEGRDLVSVMKDYPEGKVPEYSVIKWTKEILEALDYLHGQSPPIIYRDLKPGNVMLRTSDEKIFLVDFGIARTVNPESNTLKTTVGTPAFAPPELYEGKTEPRSDIYSLGATMHCLLSGVIPPGPYAFKPLRSLNPAVSPAVEAIIMKTLAMSPGDRYKNIQEMKEALNSISCLSDMPTLPPGNQSFSTGEATEKVFSPPVLPVADSNINIPEEIQKTETESSSKSPYSDVIEGEKKVLKADQKPEGKKRIIFLSIFIFLILGGLYFAFNYFKETPPVPREMVLIPGGEVRIGSDNGGEDEKPVHTVEISPFYINNYEVTVEEYCKFLNSEGNKTEDGITWVSLDTGVGIIYNPDMGVFKSQAGYEKKPAVYISWYGAVAYCNWLSDQENLDKCYGEINNRGNVDIRKNGYRLPTEAEWEYVYRKGSTLVPPDFSTRYYWGNTMDYAFCWYTDNSGGIRHVVGQKKPTSSGLYDMSGNVWEWCSDWYGPYSEEKATDPAGPEKGKDRVYRGGGWFGGQDCCRSCDRFEASPTERTNGLGFRPVKSKRDQVSIRM